MKSWLKPLAVAAFLVAAASPALANIANPNRETKPRKSVAARMQLRPDPDVKQATLIIPRAVLQQLRAEMDGVNESDAAGTTAAGGFNLTPTQTALAGLCLSLSLVFGGMWLLKSRAEGRKVARVAAALTVVAMAGAAAGALVYANAGPPPYARVLTSKILLPETTYYGGPYGNVKVEITNASSDYIELRLPKWKDQKEEE